MYIYISQQRESVRWTANARSSLTPNCAVRVT